MTKMRRIATTFALILATAPITANATPPAASDLPTAKHPEDVGMSAERLPRISEAIQRHIDERRLAGAVTLVARRGEVVHFAAQGLMDLDTKRPMRTDTLFRMASCTKPVTCVTILMLMEEGKLKLTDPVEKYIPEFKNMKASPTTRPTSNPTSQPDLVRASRPITIRDLLTHTSGLGSGGASARELTRILDDRKPTDTLADVVPQFARTPLDFQPGSLFRYSGLAAFDTLARIVEVVSGQTYEQFLSQRLFEPLGMHDTFFRVPDEQKYRLATIYRTTPNGLEKMPSPGFLSVPTYFSGGGGLTSTAADYARFAQMLVNGGELNGRRILSPRTVELMRTNQTGDLFPGQLGRPTAGMGFGLGVEVVLDPAKAGWRRSAGSFGWDGAFGTIFIVDPKEQMVMVLMVQRPGQDIYRDFENAVEQAIVD